MNPKDAMQNIIPVALENHKRRQLIQTATIAAGVSMLGITSSRVWAAGSDKSEKTEVKIGFIPLTDWASFVMASVLSFVQKIRY